VLIGGECNDVSVLAAVGVVGEHSHAEQIGSVKGAARLSGITECLTRLSLRQLSAVGRRFYRGRATSRRSFSDLEALDGEGGVVATKAEAVA